MINSYLFCKKKNFSEILFESAVNKNKEIPRTLRSRYLGSSKIGIKDIINAIHYLFKIYLTK